MNFLIAHIPLPSKKICAYYCDAPYFFALSKDSELGASNIFTYILYHIIQKMSLHNLTLILRNHIPNLTNITFRYLLCLRRLKRARISHFAVILSAFFKSEFGISHKNIPKKSTSLHLVFFDFRIILYMFSSIKRYGSPKNR